jgi:hypothetical protein
MTITMTDAEALAARVAAGGAFLDVREPGWLYLIDLATLDLHAPCRCVLGQLATDKHGNVNGWTWTGICSVFNISTWHTGASNDYNLGFNAGWASQEPPLRDQYDMLTAEWRRYIERRRAAEATS